MTMPQDKPSVSKKQIQQIVNSLYPPEAMAVRIPFTSIGLPASQNQIPGQIDISLQFAWTDEKRWQLVNHDFFEIID